MKSFEEISGVYVKNEKGKLILREYESYQGWFSEKHLLGVQIYHLDTMWVRVILKLVFPPNLRHAVVPLGEKHPGIGRDWGHVRPWRVEVENIMATPPPPALTWHLLTLSSHVRYPLHFTEQYLPAFSLIHVELLINQDINISNVKINKYSFSMVGSQRRTPQNSNLSVSLCEEALVKLASLQYSTISVSATSPPTPCCLHGDFQPDGEREAFALPSWTARECTRTCREERSANPSTSSQR